MSEPVIDKAKTALVVVNLQKAIAAQPTIPHPEQGIIKNIEKLVNTFRKKGLPVLLVHVLQTKETRLPVASDKLFSRPAAVSLDRSDFVPEIAPASTDIVITKKQWGAFYGADLEHQLRRRGTDTIVVCGIATDFGIESETRFAHEYGFRQIFAEDAMVFSSEDHHNAAVQFIFKKIGSSVWKTDEILQALQ